MNPSTLEQWVGQIVERAVSAAAEKVLARIEERLAAKASTADGPAYLDMKRLGDRFGVSRRAMRARLQGEKYAALKALARKVNGKTMFLASDVDAFMRSGGK